MPVVDFDPKNKVATTNFDYPKLKLKNGERARIVLLEQPIVEYVHTLRKPQIINGVPQMGTEKRRDGTEYQDYKRDFLSRPLCLGDFTTLSNDGVDPANCPICALAKSNPDWVQAPQRRYAMHVVRYKTKAGGFDIITPYSVDVVVWSFTDTIFNQIVDFKEEWGDLRQRDLNLGPCSNETFQKFDLNVAAKAAWLESDDRKQHTVEAFQNNKIPDLTIACGSKKERRWIDTDLDAIREAWGIVSGSSVTPGAVAAPASTTSLESDLEGLLDSPAAPAATAPAASAPEAPAEPAAAPAEVPTQPAAPAAETKKAEEKPAATSDFDDLLADMG